MSDRILGFARSEGPLSRRQAGPHPHLLNVARHTYAVVLAGGRGSRLGPLTDARAKPAVPFGGKLRIIDFALSNCVNSGLRRVGVVTQYKAQSLIRHVQHGWGFLEPDLGESIEVMPAQQRTEGSWYTGTANAVFQNLDLLRAAFPEYVLVLAGDHVYKMDYGALLADHVASGAEATVACNEVPLADACAFGVVAVDGAGRITEFQEKPARPKSLPGDPRRALASMGIYVFNAGFLYAELARDAEDRASGHDFGRDVIPHIVARCRVFAHRFPESCVNMVGALPYWRDVGTVDAYWEANMDLTQVVPALNLYDDAWPIWSRQQQLPPAKFVFNDDGRRGHAIDSLVSGGCIVSGADVQRSLLSWKVRVGEHSSVEDSVILPRVEIGRHVRLRRAIVDKGCVIPDGFAAGLNLEEDRRRFHVTERGIVLITAAMLGQAGGQLVEARAANSR